MRALLLCLVLAGCATPTLIKEPVEVRVPVMVPCVPKAVPLPEWATDALEVQASYEDRVKAMGAEIFQRIAYEVQLLGAIAGCSTKEKP